MTYDAHTRDAYRRALAALTGVTTIGALTACGWLAGMAARDHSADQQAKETARQQTLRQAQADWQRQQAAWVAAQPRQLRVRTIWKRRPEVTVVDTRVVRTASIGTGGSVRATSGSTYAGSTSRGGSGSSAGGSRGGGGGSGPSAPPPPPRPAPAPSSGS